MPAQGIFDRSLFLSDWFSDSIKAWFDEDLLVETVVPGTQFVPLISSGSGPGMKLVGSGGGLIR